MCIIIGIDPGVQKVGFGILQIENNNIKIISCGVIETEKNMTAGERLSSIRKNLKFLLEKFKPDIAGIELLYFSKNIKTAIAVAQARGVILETLNSHEIKNIHEMTPTKVKQTLLGNGKADKKQVQVEISRFFKLDYLIQPDDASDALAIALCCNRLRLI